MNPLVNATDVCVAKYNFPGIPIQLSIYSLVSHPFVVQILSCIFLNCLESFFYHSVFPWPRSPQMEKSMWSWLKKNKNKLCYWEITVRTFSWKCKGLFVQDHGDPSHVLVKTSLPGCLKVCGSYFKNFCYVPSEWLGPPNSCEIPSLRNLGKQFLCWLASLPFISYKNVFLPLLDLLVCVNDLNM